MAVLSPEIDIIDALLAAVAGVGRGRIAIAEDNDEYGARWVVARGASGILEIVHRRYILNADPDDDGEVAAAIADLDGDPRADDIAGVDAAATAAELFGVPPEPMRDAERGSTSAWEEIGTVAGPFPWWGALRLPWPVPSAGAVLGWTE